MHRHVKPGLTWESLLLLGTEMARRSDFKRVARDAYDTPSEAVKPLLPFLQHKDGRRRFVEPCAGAGKLVGHLVAAGHVCVGAYDIEPRAPGIEVLSMTLLGPDELNNADLIITNPPWDRKLLHDLIMHAVRMRIPAWLLIDANWMFTAQAVGLLRHCRTIVTVGRVKWIPGTTMTGKDDAAWMLFQPDTVDRITFIPKQLSQGAAK